jgi:hypothetical protein
MELRLVFIVGLHQLMSSCARFDNYGRPSPHLKSHAPTQNHFRSRVSLSNYEERVKHAAAADRSPKLRAVTSPPFSRIVHQLKIKYNLITSPGFKTENNSFEAAEKGAV